MPRSGDSKACTHSRVVCAIMLVFKRQEHGVELVGAVPQYQHASGADSNGRTTFVGCMKTPWRMIASVFVRGKLVREGRSNGHWMANKMPAMGDENSEIALWRRFSINIIGDNDRECNLEDYPIMAMEKHGKSERPGCISSVRVQSW